MSYDSERLDSVIAAVNALAERVGQFEPPPPVDPQVDNTAAVERVERAVATLTLRLEAVERDRTAQDLLGRYDLLAQALGVAPVHQHDPHPHPEFAERSHGHEPYATAIATLDQVTGEQKRTGAATQVLVERVGALLDAEASALRGMLHAHEAAPHAWVGHPHPDLAEALTAVEQKLLQLLAGSDEAAKSLRSKFERFVEHMTVRVDELDALLRSEVARLSTATPPEHAHYLPSNGRVVVGRAVDQLSADLQAVRNDLQQVHDTLRLLSEPRAEQGVV